MKISIKRTIGLLVLLLTSYSVWGQVNQLVKGKIIDSGNQPVINATIKLIRADTTVNTSTNASGEFSINVLSGRYIIECSAEGFTQSSEELLVVAGKMSSLTFVMKPEVTKLEDVEVKSPQYIQDVPGAYALSIEKTIRVPANFFDPVRLTLSLPGVVPTNDQSNSISIKGYSPNALSWRLMGLDIVNPNHLANAGTLSDKPMANGGGVSILSSQVLDQTSFYSGALPIQYGNALSGAFDMSLRPGSKFSREHTVQASLLGIDLATEGPFGKTSKESGSNGSYLINYRYSTVGLLSLAGVNFGDEKINFQDLTFHLDFNQKKGRHLSVFGFGGLSTNNFDHKDQSEWETEKDRYDIDFKGKVYGIGFTSTLLSTPSSQLRFGVAASGQDQTRESQSQNLPSPIIYINSENYSSSKNLVSSSLNFTQRISSSVSLLAGTIATYIDHRLDVSTVSPLNLNDLYPNLNGTVNGVLWQPYLNAEIKSRFADFTVGGRYVNFSYNNTSSFEPRANVGLNLFAGRLNLAYGITSQIQQTQTYLALENASLALNKAHQFSIRYKKSFGEQLTINASGFYHHLFDVASSIDTYPFSTINQMDEFVYTNLYSNGTGRNRGFDISVDKKFTNLFYLLGGASWYTSGYANSSSPYYTSRYNGKYTYTLSAGKEWNGKKNRNFGIHARALYLGGLRQPVVNETLSGLYGTTVYDYNGNLYQVQLPDYFRIDLRASWRKNKPGYTRIISIDIQNVTGQQNVAYYYYDTYTRKTETKYQLGLIPVLVYRIDF